VGEKKRKKEILLNLVKLTFFISKAFSQLKFDKFDGNGGDLGTRFNALR